MEGYNSVVFLLLSLILCIHGQWYNWCYEGSCGPSSWTGFCKSGTRQSPINILLNQTVKSRPGKSSGKKILKFSKEFYENTNWLLTNNGHTLELIEEYDPATWTFPPLTVEGAGWSALGTDFQLVYMLFHWGSEHMVKGKRFPLELQLYFHSEEGEWGVISILYAETRAGSAVLQPIIDLLPQLTNPWQGWPTLTLNVSSLFPNVWDLFRYEGSLTTPNCKENVLWSIFTQRMPVSASQVQQFATMKDNNGNLMKKNYRPVKPLVTANRKHVVWMPVNKNKMMNSAF